MVQLLVCPHPVQRCCRREDDVLPSDDTVHVFWLQCGSDADAAQLEAPLQAHLLSSQVTTMAFRANFLVFAVR